MYIIKNALKNLARNKGRNLLLSAIILAIVATTVVTLSITNTSDSIIDDYRQRFGSRVIISPDMDAVMEMLQDTLQNRPEGGRPITGTPVAIPQVSPQQNLAFAASPYIREYSIAIRHNADNPDLIPADVTESLPFMMMGNAGLENMEDIEDIILPNFRLIGGAWDEDFAVGTRQISHGHFPQSDYEALISMEVAALNNLVIGDEIRLYSNLFAEEELRTIYRDLTVVGFYLDMTEDLFAGFMTSPFTNRRNEVLTTLNTVMSHMGENDLGFQVDATFYLHNPSYLPAFEVFARSIGLDDMMLISTNEAEFNAIVAPVEGLRSVAQTFMWVVLILGGIILIILSSIAVRERKYEIGVLRAMGMKKRKVAAGLWVEILALTVICLGLGLGIGSVAAQPISDNLLAAQVEDAPSQDATFLPGRGGMQMQMSSGMSIINMGGSNANYTPLDALDISMGVGTILEIAGITLLITSLAALVAIIGIIKYEPMKILMERD